MKNNIKKLTKTERVTEIKVYLYESDKRKIEEILKRNPEIPSRSEMFRQMLNNQYEMEINEYEQEKQEKIENLINSINAFYVKYDVDDMLDWDGEKY